MIRPEFPDHSQDDVDLKELALTAKSLPPGSSERQKILDRLWRKIYPHRLAYPQRGNYLQNPRQYEDLRNEAISRVGLEVARRIDHYNPNYPVMAWVNNLMDHRFKDVVKDRDQAGLRRVPHQQVNGESVRVRSLDQLNQKAKVRMLDDLNQNADGSPTEGELLRRFLQEDPENRLNLSIRGRSEATFTRILLLRLDNWTWEQISAEIGPPPIRVQTLCKFFNTHWCNLLPYLQNYLQE